MMDTILLSHGGGGKEMNELLSSLFYKHFGNEILLKAEDAAILTVDKQIAFTTDSFTVSPIEFNGGNIGTLAIAGSVNDVAMMGAKPLYLSVGFMIEEGLAVDVLERIVISMAQELNSIDAKIVCGDTKVVPKGCVDRVFINTSCIGEVIRPNISAHNISEDDTIIVSNQIGQHGASIFAHREGIDADTLHSDCAVLYPAIEALIEADIEIKSLRDATRGGVAAVLNEWADASNICLEIDEASIPISDEVRGMCELFGFEPYDFANEGTFVLAVASSDATRAIEVLSSQEVSKHSAIIGKATQNKPKKVILKNPWGSSRYLELPKGELLPRIC
jgi:hydrogenase expression/formation protein HypE